MLSKKMQEGLNGQLNYELYSAYVYFSMEAYFLDRNMKGFANWMHVQAQEEMFHASKFFNFIDEMDGRVLLAPIEGPKTEWDEPLDAFKNALEHEQSVTKRIDDLVELAVAEKNHATQVFLQWFVNEQVEEESNVKQLIEDLKMVKEAPGGVFLLDRELGARTFAVEAGE